MKPGSRIGIFEIVSRLGAGGMGEVLLARDTRLDRHVAIKALPEHLANNPDRLARFEREAKIVASLNHPGIAAVYALEENAGKTLLVMEYVNGETLAARLKRGRMPVDEAIRVAVQTAEAMEAAHERGIVHRDLKPGNIMVTRDGVVKVLDFGLARSAEPSGMQTVGQRETDPDSPTITLKSPVYTESPTAPGAILGTAGYMSPEQARGKPVDRRSDIFSFGCVLYAMLTGNGPFAGETPTDSLGAILHKEPDWTALPEETPRRIRELLTNCLAKDRKQRLHDIADARLELTRAIAGQEHAAETTRALRPTQGAWKVALPWVIAGVALAGAGLAMWRATRHEPGTKDAPAPSVAWFTANDPNFPHWAAPDLASLAISDDGELIVYTGMHSDGNRSMFVRRLSDPRARELRFPNVHQAHNPAISPDGRWVAFALGPELLKIPIDGGQPVKLLSTQGLSKGHTWTSRGIIVSPAPSAGLVRVSADGGPPEPLTTPDPARGEVSHRWPDALPGGRFVLFTVKKADLASFDDAEIALLDVAAGTWRTIIRGGSYARYAPSGHIVYARAGSLLAVPFDAATGQVTGAPILVLSGVVTEPGSGAAQFAVAREAGTLAYVPGAPNIPRYELVWIDLDGKQTPVDAPQRHYSGMSVSPDGTRVALSVFGATDSVFVYDLARRTFTRITYAGNAAGPCWSPDGRRIAYRSEHGGAFAAFARDADGSGEPQLLAANIPGRFGLASLDGRDAVLYESDSDLWLKPAPAEALAQRLFATPVSECHAVVSPDQRWLAYSSDESGQFEVYVRPFPSGAGKWQVSLGGGAMPWWLSGSKDLAYRGADGAIRIVHVKGDDFANARPELLCQHPQGVAFLELLPDGSRFLAIRGVPSPPHSGRVEVALHWAADLKTRVPATMH